MTTVEPLAEASQTRPIVSFQGMRGAFSDEVIDAIWRGTAKTIPVRDFPTAVMAVANGHATHAIVPIHNSTMGAVVPGCQAIAGNTEVVTAGEFTMTIRFALLALPGVTLDAVRHVYSHPAALAQCTALFTRYPRMVAVETFDTAGAAFEIASRRDVAAAALAPAKAAARYGLSALARDVQDREDNATRFAIVMRRSVTDADALPTGPKDDVLEPAQNGGAVDLGVWSEERLRERGFHHDDRPTLVAIRGAITVVGDDASLIAIATREVLCEIISANRLAASDVVSAIFTVTPDLRSAFPAAAARELPGWAQTPLLCAVEIDVAGSLPRCIRVLVHANRPLNMGDVQHMYIGAASALRPDLAGRPV